eukprot:scaffold285_cov304-Pinguiococcus_pyrenoidosus.AAC.4
MEPKVLLQLRRGETREVGVEALISRVVASVLAVTPGLVAAVHLVRREVGSGLLERQMRQLRVPRLPVWPDAGFRAGWWRRKEGVAVALRLLNPAPPVVVHHLAVQRLHVEARSEHQLGHVLQRVAEAVRAE